MLRKLGTFLALGGILAGAAVWAQSGGGTTHVMLSNDQRFLVSNDKYLSGIYECADGGYIDSSCIIGHFPEVSCPAGFAIQVISPSISPATCIEVGGGGDCPAGSDTYVQYNGMGVCAADQNFTWNYTDSILTLGGAGPGTATFSGETLVNLPAGSSDGTIGYCTDCVPGSTPCVGSGTGAIAERLNGAWTCGAGSGVSGTTNHMAKFTSSTTVGDSEALEDGTTLTVTGLDLKYTQALYIAGQRAISTSVAADATDRNVNCTSGSSTDKTYTLPAATGSGRVIDVIKVDSGTNACIVGVPAGALNSGTIATLASQWQAETCMDIGSALWFCRGPAVIS